MDISRTVTCPCNGCTDRWFNSDTLERCHSSCTKYMNYKNEIEERRNYFNEERKINSFCFELGMNQRYKSQIKRISRKKKQLYKTL